MKKRSRKLRAKMRACRTVARAGGVMTAASLMLVSKGYSEALRFQVDDNIPPYTPELQGYDLDGDGDSDIYFNVSLGYAVSMEAEKYSYGGGPQQTCAVIVNEFNFVKGHEAGILINNVDPPAGQSSGPLSDEFTAPSSPRYAGFFFCHEADSTFHQAWIELEVTGTIETGYGLDVIAYGYETEPDTGILAGYPQTPTSAERSTWSKIKALLGE